MQWNATASGGGLAFPLQNLMAAYGPTEPINDWIFQKPGATIDTPTNLTAAQHLEQWVKAGYFPKDANAIEYTDANARFGKGEGVFMFNGDWQNAVYDKDLSGQRRVLRLPARRGRRHARRDVGAADLRHRQHGEERRLRRVLLQLGRHEREGSSDRRRPSAARTPVARPTSPFPPAAAGSVTNDTLAAGADVAKDNGAMDFIANATGSIFAQGWTPELQKLVGGKTDAAGLLKAVQAEYEKELAQLRRTAADEARPRQADASQHRPLRQLVGGSTGGSPGPGDPPADPRRLAVRRCRPWSCTASSCSNHWP